MKHHHRVGAAYDTATTQGHTPLVSNGGPEVVVELEARPAEWDVGGRAPLDGSTYNGQVPGPTIEARVGDTLVVRLTNRLSEPMTIHWHGLRLPSAMDGTEDTHRPVGPGETFTHRFALPTRGRSGTTRMRTRRFSSSAGFMVC